MHKFSFLLLFLLSAFSISSQTGRISGTILDAKTGETLPGATVLIEGTTKGAAADFDGKFSINNVPVGKVNLIISFISYTTKKISGVEVKANDVVDINVLLDASASTELQEVEVVVTLNKENNTALVLQQKNSASVSDGISAETIKRTPDKTTSDVLKRISGVTIQNDKFVVVRGLNERYNASYLNGSPLPSTEPDKKAFAFDLFPSNMLDNIVVNKTATPDMPSEFAGGIIQINTKSIPEKNFVLFSLGGGYNTITTGKDKIVYEGGKLDMFGFDDGSRDLPSQVPALEDKNTWISNPDQARVATYFPNDWGFSQSKFSPNFSAQFATGYNVKRKDKDFLGVIFSLSYNSTQNLYKFQRTEYDGLAITGSSSVTVQKEREYFNDVYQTQNATGALLNLGLKLNENNSISLKNMLSGSSDDRFIYSLGSNNFTEAEQSINRVNSRFFSANRLLTNQLNGDHYLPASKIKIGWNVGYSNIERTVPNLRFTSYSKFQAIRDPSDPNPLDTVFRAELPNGSTTGPAYSGYRVYSELNENIISSKVDVSKLFKLTESLKLDVKAGGLYQFRERQFNIRQFGLSGYNAPNSNIYFDNDLAYLPEDQIFATENMSVTPDGKGGFKAFEITKPDDNYHASSKLMAAYGMGELKVEEKFRVIAGARFESYYQNITIDYFITDSIFVDNTVNDVLPSLNLIYNVTAKTGLRFSYYKTLNRPEFRELAVTNWYDPETRLSVAGNASLTRSYIENLDLRYEMYPGRGQLFTVTGFYKYFDTPIERYMFQTSENQIYYRNANFGHVYGGELEFRVNMGAVLRKDSVKFLNNLTLFSNLSLIKSEVNVEGINPAVPNTRPMQGQAPYLLNAGISYIDNERAYSITAMVNRVGERIYIVGNDIIPNRWENARTIVDLQFTKSFLKNRLELRFNIKDLLHPDWVVYYKGSDREKNGYQKDIDYVNFKRNYGTTYSFLIAYKF